MEYQELAVQGLGDSWADGNGWSRFDIADAAAAATAVRDIEDAAQVAFDAA